MKEQAVSWQEPCGFLQLIERQVAQTPDAIALVCEEQVLTYRVLNQRANQLAYTLRKQGVKPEVAVGLCLERSLNLVIGFLGILKAGGVYVPLDPAYPKERLAYILKDAQIEILLMHADLLEPLQEYVTAIQVIYLDAPQNTHNVDYNESPQDFTFPGNLAYVIYTSGSTGKPKGVLVSHQGLGNLALAQAEALGLSAQDRVLQFASCSFDASISEISVTLSIGATLLLYPQRAAQLAVALPRIIEEYAISSVTLPPSLLRMLPPGTLSTVKTLISAGEVCTDNEVAQWSQQRCFINGYGPTEATVCASMAVGLDGSQVLSIGHPIANVQIYILDRYLQSVPIGATGELYIGGIGIARGYLKRPELTAERFIPDSFSQQPGARLYRTGDLASYLPDGAIRFIGRSDQQVKLHGFRIELGEIEAVLGQHPAVRDAVVIMQEAGSGDKQLVAYLTAQSTCSLHVAELRGFLQKYIPAYMLPARYVVLETFPVMPNGKIDKQRLITFEGWETEIEEEINDSFRSELEYTIAQIWQ